MDMIEKVARAIWADEHPDTPYEQAGWKEQMTREGWARAAIEAMREPTEDMLWMGPGSPYMDKDVWAQMIDEALKPAR